MPPEHLLPGREGRNATLPYNLIAYRARSGVGRVTSNCLTCHAPPPDQPLPASVRPWRRPKNLSDYDGETLGLRYIELTAGKEATDADERKWVYDTTLPGYSNRGHTFGDRLTDEERRSVVEYLKTL